MPRIISNSLACLLYKTVVPSNGFWAMLPSLYSQGGGWEKEIKVIDETGVFLVLNSTATTVE